MIVNPTPQISMLSSMENLSKVRLCFFPLVPTCAKLDFEHWNLCVCVCFPRGFHFIVHLRYPQKDAANGSFWCRKSYDKSTVDLYGHLRDLQPQWLHMSHWWKRKLWESKSQEISRKSVFHLNNSSLSTGWTTFNSLPPFFRRPFQRKSLQRRNPMPWNLKAMMVQENNLKQENSKLLVGNWALKKPSAAFSQKNKMSPALFVRPPKCLGHSA